MSNLYSPTYPFATALGLFFMLKYIYNRKLLMKMRFMKLHNKFLLHTTLEEYYNFKINLKKLFSVQMITIATLCLHITFSVVNTFHTK